MPVLWNRTRRGRRAPVRKRPSLDFSLVGLTYTCMMLFMGVAAMNSNANLLYGVFGLMIGVLVVSAVISHMVLRKLEVRRSLPDFAVVGEPATFIYEFANLKRYWPSLSVTLGELSSAEAFTKQPQTYLLHAAAGTTAAVPAEIIPTRRGAHPLEQFQLITSFPFGFIRRAVDRRQKDTILVHPPRAEVDSRLLSLCISAEQSGTRMRPRRGGTDEFYGVKEFRQGENPRWIYWRRSARTGTLVAKEMTQIAPPRLLVLVDTFIATRDMASHAAVERAIAMAGSLVWRTADGGLAVGLCVWSGQWVLVSPSRGKRHARELLGVLARLPLNMEQRCAAVVEASRQLMRPGTTAVLLTPGPGGSGDAARHGSLVIGSESEESRRWFRFALEVDFERCIPPDQAAVLDLLVEPSKRLAVSGDKAGGTASAR